MTNFYGEEIKSGEVYVYDFIQMEDDTTIYDILLIIDDSWESDLPINNWKQENENSKVRAVYFPKTMNNLTATTYPPPLNEEIYIGYFNPSTLIKLELNKLRETRKKCI
jgi:hypothetical protein